MYKDRTQNYDPEIHEEWLVDPEASSGNTAIITSTNEVDVMPDMLFLVKMVEWFFLKMLPQMYQHGQAKTD